MTHFEPSSKSEKLLNRFPCVNKKKIETTPKIKQFPGKSKNKTVTVMIKDPIKQKGLMPSQKQKRKLIFPVDGGKL